MTGAAHCRLAPFWATRLGRNLAGYEASAQSGTVGVQGVPDRGRVLLLGQAVTVLRGDLTA